MADGGNKEEVGQFVMVTHNFIKCAAGMKYKHHARWLYTVLLSFRNQQTGEAFPSYETLIKLTGTNREGISKGLTELEYWGWLDKKRQFGRSTVYKVHLVRRKAQVDLDYKAGRPLDSQVWKLGNNQ